MFRCCIDVSNVNVEDPKLPPLVKINKKDPVLDAAKAAVETLDDSTQVVEEAEEVDVEVEEVEVEVEGENINTQPEDDSELLLVCKEFITFDTLVYTVVVATFVTFLASLTSHVHEEECMLEGF